MRGFAIPISSEMADFEYAISRQVIETLTKENHQPRKPIRM